MTAARNVGGCGNTLMFSLSSEEKRMRPRIIRGSQPSSTHSVGLTSNWPATDAESVRALV